MGNGYVSCFMRSEVPQTERLFRAPLSRQVAAVSDFYNAKGRVQAFSLVLLMPENSSCSALALVGSRRGCAFCLLAARR